MASTGTSPRVSIVMPCLNEAATLAACIATANEAIRSSNLDAEIIVADNGSTDGSQEIARNLGARVVAVAEPGYGSALRGGIAAAHGTYIVMGDSDESYDFAAVPAFVEELGQGYDLVMGNRFKGGIEKGAMPWLHKFVGNPVLTRVGKVFFRSGVGDFHCGLRAFTRDAYERMELTSTGMEFASEMVIRASINNMRISEIPTVLRKDGRDRPPHLNTWRDGWRHLRLMLLYSPRWLFMIPGLCLFIGGALIVALLVQGPVFIGHVGFDVDTMLIGGFLCLVGYQLTVFALFTKVFVIREGLHPPNATLSRIYNYVHLEHGVIAGFVMTLAGGVTLVAALLGWVRANFGELDPRPTLRLAIPAGVLLCLGIETIFASFFLSILGVPKREIDRRAGTGGPEAADPGADAS